MADAVGTILPAYFDNLFRFLAWFRLHPQPAEATATNSVQLINDRYLGAAAGRAMPYPSQNRWIVDQVALWLALGRLESLRFADFAPSDVWQGAEFQQMPEGGPFPLLCHYYGENTRRFFSRLQQLSQADPTKVGRLATEPPS